MARLESSFWALVALVVTTSCTVFNGKTLQEDAGSSPSPSCGCANVPGAVVCEDFEGGTLSSLWQTAKSDQPPLIETSQPHCGTRSLHLHSRDLAPGESFSSTLIESETFSKPSLSGGFYVRAWVYARRGFTITRDNFMALFEAHQATGNYLGIAAQLGATTAAIANWTTTPLGFASTDASLTRDGWTCVEWRVAIAVTGSSELWIAGASASLDQTNTSPTPAYDALIIGIFFSGLQYAQPAVDLWIDDLVIGSQRIGCGP